jgi:undecaprenyl diphosphate synthase
MCPQLPHHVAIIMDGNGRWAEQRQLPRVAGHRAGVEAVRRTVRACATKEVEVLTLFAFSSENWRRPRHEVGFLMELFVTSLEQEAERLHENSVRLRFIGDRSAFPARLIECIEYTERLTDNNGGLTLIIAANYGGRWDMTQAARELAKKAAAGLISADVITEDTVAAHLSLHGLPEPDLFIRTGGDQRVSNFLLWQLAYAELYFTECLWPDFGPAQFEAALESYAQRQRRFGRTGEQLRQARSA